MNYACFTIPKVSHNLSIVISFLSIMLLFIYYNVTGSLKSFMSTLTGLMKGSSVVEVKINNCLMKDSAPHLRGCDCAWPPNSVTWIESNNASIVLIIFRRFEAAITLSTA